MSTELLTRRMDLIHSNSKSTTYNRDTLQMDTSYPVRLSGIIIKVFLATNDYSDLNQNGNKVSDDSIKFVITSKSSSDFKIEIPYSKVFDFEGKRLKPNGFILGDYVLAVIDIDKKEIYLNSLKNADRSGRSYADKYKRELNYYCNGKNDNVVLQGIINELLSLYDINNDINESNQEYDLTISAQEKLDVFTNGKFTINIIGKFGIDYSQTKFTYGGFNRQNRSSIMTISGNTEKSEISNDDDLDMELILNWENCYIPKIAYDSNEKCAALYNTKKFTRLGSGEVVYYDYWSKKNSAHFTYQKGNTSTPYGNLFPRRLVFASIEGNLPLNITFKNFSLTTFGVGIYCETDSNKTIKIIDSKISILNNMTYGVDLNNMPGDKFDITHPDFYKYMFVPLGSAIDVNAFNPSVEIINCKIKNASGNRDSNLIINSCNNMRIINSTIKDFNDYSDGYKDACTMPCMDFEYFYDYSFSIENEEEQYTILNPNISLKTYNDKTTTQNPNYIDIIIAHTMFYGGGEPHSRIPNKLLLMMKNRDNNTPYSESDFKDLDFSDLDSYYKSIQNNSTLTGVILTECKFNVESKFKPGFYDTCGCIKNIPLVYKSSPEFGKANNYTLEINKYNDNVKTSTYSNKETEFMPNLFIDSSTIRATGVLYQFNANTIINNSKIFAYQFDNRYRTFQINLISGELSINNCECNYDARIKSYNGVPFRSDDNTEFNPSFIKVYPVLYSIKNPEEFDESYKYIPHYLNNASLHDYQVSAPSVSILTPSKLNINNTKMIMFPDVKYNIPGLNSFKDINTRDDSTTLNKIVVFRPNNNIMNQYYETSSSIHFISTFSDDNKDDLLVPSKSKSFFNPLTAPNINVSNSEFLVDNTMSFSDSYGSNKIMNNTGNNNNSDTTLCTLFKLDDRSINAFLNNSAVNYKLFSDTEIANIKNDPSSFNYQDYNTSYYNIVDIVMKSDSNIDHIFKIYNFTLKSSSGKIITITKFKNGTFNVDESSTIDLTNLTSVGKIKKMGLYKEYEFYRKNILISAYGIVHELKFSELPHSGYYLYNNIMDMIHDKNNGYQYRTLDTYYDFNNINDKFNNFGVVSFKLENAVFNMNNCKIGGFTGSSMRHTYGYETFIKRSPRICFDFGGNGVYKVNNTNANAWATVLWSHINKSAFYKYNNELEDVIAPFDSSTLDMANKGVLSINNCEFINYNALRFRQVSEDWMDYLGSNYYKGINYKSTKEIFDKGNFKYNLGSDSDSNTLRKQNSINSQAYSNYESWGLSASMSSATDGDFELNKSIFNESVRNANEMPIMFIYNHQLVDSQINYSKIMGNESVIIGGKVHFNNDILINNNNAMICYIDKFGTDSSDNIAPKVYFNNCDIIATKDVIYDSYINHDTLSEDNCVSKGMSKYNNIIAAFYIETDESYLELNGNNINYKCNAYDDMYYIDYDTKVRLIYYKYYNCFNTKHSSSNYYFNPSVNFTKNNISMLFDCPVKDGKRVLPNSNNISVIEINNNNLSSDYTNYYNKRTYKTINVNDNTFNIYNVFLYGEEYYIYNNQALEDSLIYNKDTGFKTILTFNDTTNILLHSFNSDLKFDSNVNPDDVDIIKYNNEVLRDNSIPVESTITLSSGTKIKIKSNFDNSTLYSNSYIGYKIPIIYSNMFVNINMMNNTIHNSKFMSEYNFMHSSKKFSLVSQCVLLNINDRYFKSNNAYKIYQNNNTDINIKDNILDCNNGFTIDNDKVNELLSKENEYVRVKKSNSQLIILEGQDKSNNIDIDINFNSSKTLTKNIVNVDSYHNDYVKYVIPITGIRGTVIEMQHVKDDFTDDENLINIKSVGLDLNSFRDYSSPIIGNNNTTLFLKLNSINDINYAGDDTKPNYYIPHTTNLEMLSYLFDMENPPSDQNIDCIVKNIASGNTTQYLKCLKIMAVDSTSYIPYYRIPVDFSDYIIYNNKCYFRVNVDGYFENSHLTANKKFYAIVRDSNNSEITKDLFDYTSNPSSHINDVYISPSFITENHTSTTDNSIAIYTGTNADNMRYVARESFSTIVEKDKITLNKNTIYKISYSVQVNNFKDKDYIYLEKDLDRNELIRIDNSNFKNLILIPDSHWYNSNIKKVNVNYNEGFNIYPYLTNIVTNGQDCCLLNSIDSDGNDNFNKYTYIDINIKDNTSLVKSVPNTDNKMKLSYLKNILGDVYGNIT